MGVDHADYWLSCNGLQLPEGHFANLDRGPRVDHDDALAADDEDDIRHEALIFRRWKAVGRFDHEHVLRDFRNRPVADRAPAFSRVRGSEHGDEVGYTGGHADECRMPQQRTSGRYHGVSFVGRGSGQSNL